LRYGFESLMANEFHTLNGTCSSLAPSGPGYENITLVNQVCTTVGSVAGQDHVDGNRFLAISYGYYYSNLWRNFGIVIAFGIAFFVALLVLTEYNTTMASEASVMLFSRGAKAAVLEEAEAEASPRPDAEKGREIQASAVKPAAVEEEALQQTVKMNDVFTWRHLQYEVSVGHGEMRRLLDDVSG
jgi:ATP-binding cassette subfamily G (WHITE) protein 2 (SNQ2)